MATKAESKTKVANEHRARLPVTMEWLKGKLDIDDHIFIRGIRINTARNIVYFDLVSSEPFPGIDPTYEGAEALEWIPNKQ